jgi:hypothetical protein
MAASIVCFAAGLATAAGAQAPSRSMLQHTSRGKAGVSLEDYRADASTCARAAVNLDVSGTEAAKTLVAASRAIDTAYSERVDDRAGRRRQLFWSAKRRRKRDLGRRRP